jgi:hypothetical protein
MGITGKGIIEQLANCWRFKKQSVSWSQSVEASS